MCSIGSRNHSSPTQSSHSRKGPILTNLAPKVLAKSEISDILRTNQASVSSFSSTFGGNIDGTRSSLWGEIILELRLPHPRLTPCQYKFMGNKIFEVLFSSLFEITPHCAVSYPCGMLLGCDLRPFCIHILPDFPTRMLFNIQIRCRKICSPLLTVFICRHYLPITCCIIRNVRVAAWLWQTNNCRF